MYSARPSGKEGDAAGKQHGKKGKSRSAKDPRTSNKTGHHQSKSHPQDHQELGDDGGGLEQPSEWPEDTEYHLGDGKGNNYFDGSYMGEGSADDTRHAEAPQWSNVDAYGQDLQGGRGWDPQHAGHGKELEPANSPSPVPQARKHSSKGKHHEPTQGRPAPHADAPPQETVQYDQAGGAGASSNNAPDQYSAESYQEYGGDYAYGAQLEEPFATMSLCGVPRAGQGTFNVPAVDYEEPDDDPDPFYGPAATAPQPQSVSHVTVQLPFRLPTCKSTHRGSRRMCFCT